jgi:hypothetical protein
MRGVTFAKRRNKSSLTQRNNENDKFIVFREDEIVNEKKQTSHVDQCGLIEIDPPTGSDTLVVDQFNHKDNNL